MYERWDNKRKLQRRDMGSGRGVVPPMEGVAAETEGGVDKFIINGLLDLTGPREGEMGAIRGIRGGDRRLGDAVDVGREWPCEG